MTLRHSLVLLVLLLGLPFGSYADTLGTIRERGSVRVGVALFTPWTMRSDAGELSGFEVDVARQIAADMGVAPDIKVYDWKDIIPALEKGEIDLIAGGMAITPARALRVNFSRPYAESGVLIVTNTARTSAVKDLKELNRAGIVLAAVEDTIGFNVAKPLFDKAEIAAFRTREEAEQAVLEGKAHGYVASMEEANLLVLRHPDKVDRPMPKPLLAYPIAFGVRKGDQEWLNFLDAWVTARDTDNWLSTAGKYWFQTLDWQRPATQK
jgi:polar amino acid transport system substrate-binding protein